MGIRKGSAGDRGLLTIAGFLISGVFLATVITSFNLSIGVLGSAGDTASLDKLASKTREKCGIAVDDTEDIDDFEVDVSFSNLNSLSIEEQSDGPDRIVADFVDSTSERQVEGCNLTLEDENDGDNKLESGQWSVVIACENNCGTEENSDGRPDIRLVASKR